MGDVDVENTKLGSGVTHISHTSSYKHNESLGVRFFLLKNITITRFRCGSSPSHIILPNSDSWKGSPKHIIISYIRRDLG